jgi:hypothetical protein
MDYYQTMFGFMKIICIDLGVTDTVIDTTSIVKKYDIPTPNTRPPDVQRMIDDNNDVKSNYEEEEEEEEEEGHFSFILV